MAKAKRARHRTDGWLNEIGVMQCPECSRTGRVSQPGDTRHRGSHGAKAYFRCNACEARFVYLDREKERELAIKERLDRERSLRGAIAEAQRHLDEARRNVEQWEARRLRTQQEIEAAEADLAVLVKQKTGEAP